MKVSKIITIELPGGQKISTANDAEALEGRRHEARVHLQRLRDQYNAAAPGSVEASRIDMSSAGHDLDIANRFHAKAVTEAKKEVTRAEKAYSKAADAFFANKDGPDLDAAQGRVDDAEAKLHRLTEDPYEHSFDGPADSKKMTQRAADGLAPRRSTRRRRR